MQTELFELSARLPPKKYHKGEKGRFSSATEEAIYLAKKEAKKQKIIAEYYKRIAERFTKLQQPVNITRYSDYLNELQHELQRRRNNQSSV